MSPLANPTPWPNGAAVSQVCFTRATRDLDALLGFYRDGLGLEVLYRFDDAAGPAGAMLGLPGRSHHLELLRADVADCAPPSKHNVMVLHLPERADVDALAARLLERGCMPVAPANPWWADKAVVFEDPDGWPVVLSHGSGLPQ
jgi:catechol 2,3-dioxygenase-like lactoylglutathione lyase family enzyme